MTEAAASAFPGVGHTFEVTMGADVFHLTFESETRMSAKGVKGPNRGFDETEHVQISAVRPGVYMISWQEASGTTAVFVEDFNQGFSYSHITIPDDDGTVFLRFEGDVRQIA
jgi:hypothetical protein